MDTNRLVTLLTRAHYLLQDPNPIRSFDSALCVEIRAVLAQHEAEVAVLRKRDILAEGTITVTGKYRRGSPANRNPFTGGWPEEPAEIEDFCVECEVEGVEFEPNDITLRKIEGVLIEQAETPEYARDAD